jgi:predicted component of type VI protein secretion system
MERSRKPLPTQPLALRFIAGKYKGRELVIAEGQEIILGRVGEVDVVLAEDMVSRRHARLAVERGQMLIEDFESTNGTFVNGEKIRREVLKEGDRILIGTNILKVIHADATGAAHGHEPSHGVISFDETRTAAPTFPEVNTPSPHTITSPQAPLRHDEIPSSVRSRATTTAQGSRSMSGAIHEFPLPYLLQLLESSQKSGVLVVRSEETDDVAKLYLRKGSVVYASINELEDIPPLKVVFRLLLWTRGTFDLEPPEARSFPSEVTASTQEILMEGMRQMDELNNLRPRLPDASSRLMLPRPLRPRLRDLAPSELDTLQLALNFGVLSAVIDKSQATDFEAARSLLKLIDAGYLRVG